MIFQQSFSKLGQLTNLYKNNYKKNNTNNLKKCYPTFSGEIFFSEGGGDDKKTNFLQRKDKENAKF